MFKAILGRKVGMTQVFDETGVLVPVTVIEAGPCTVVDVRTPELHGYSAVQVGFGTVSETKLNRPLRGYYKKRGLGPFRYLRELRMKGRTADCAPGTVLTVDMFKPGERVDVTGTTIGKGFAGGVKRWGFKRGPMAHGSKYHRGPGSLQSRDAARVFPGRKMPGHLGNERVTIRNLRVVKVDPEKNLLLLEGSVPGTRGSLLTIKETTVGKGGATRA